MASAQTCRTCGTTLQTSATGTGEFCPVCILRLASSDDEIVLAADNPETFPRSFGDYELLAEIGRGGMGLVFKARQRSLNRIVAIKVLIAGRFSDDIGRQRFQLEAESGARLQHPNIVAVHEIGTAEGHPFITMDFVDGPNLAELGKSQPLPARIAARYLRDIARAVEFAHAAGVLHRDLKPSNILVATDQRPLVTDFGLAKLRDSDESPTMAGQVLGSPNYTSPEQAAGRNETVGVASDIYGLGALLYHLVTGRAPFNAATPAETLRLVLDAEPPAPRLLNPALPRDLETICLKCLQKDPRLRYASATDVADELDRFLNDRAILARPVSKVELAARWCQRHPAIAGLAATVVAALLTTSFVFYTSARRIEKVRKVQEEDLYSMHIGLSAMALASSGADLRDARARLAVTRPAPDSPDLRGFEWRYLWLRAHGDATYTFRGHQQVVDQCLFSSSGNLIATHSVDGVLKLWEANGAGERQSYAGVATLGGFTPDGKDLYFSRPDRSVWRLDIATQKAGQIFPATGQLLGVASDGRHVIVLGPNHVPVTLAVDAGTVPAAADTPAGETRAAMSRDGRYVALTGPGLPGILVFEVATQAQVACFVDPRPVIALALSADGSKLVSSGFDGVLKVWRVGQPDPERAFKAFLDPSWALAFSADGEWFAASGHNRQVKLWRTATWEEAATLTGHESTTHCIAFSPDGHHLVSGGEDELALVWTLPPAAPPTEVRKLLRGPDWIDRTPDLAFSPDSRLFAGTAADGTVKVWQTDTVQCIASFPAAARTVAFSRDGKHVLGGGYDGIVRKWELAGAKAEPALVPVAQVSNWEGAPLSSEQRVEFIAAQRAALSDCSLCAIPSARDALNAGAPLTCTTLAVTPLGDSVFVGLPSGEVEAWDVDHRHLHRRYAAHKLPVTALAVSPDGRYLATGSLDNTTKLWDIAKGELLATFFAHNRPVWALAFSPDGRTLASGSCDKSVILCSVPLHRFLTSLWLYSGVPQGYEQEVRLLRFAPDGNTLAAALGDGTVHFFRAAPFSVTDVPTSATGKLPAL